MLPLALTAFSLSTLDTTLNVLFFFDIGINFFTAFYDSDYNIIDSHKVSTSPAFTLL